VFRTIFAQPDAGAVADAWDQVADQLAARFAKIGSLMAAAKAEVLAFAAFPRAHWQKIWSTNPLERINKEIKRRSRVAGIFPNEASGIRLVGAPSWPTSTTNGRPLTPLPLRRLHEPALPRTR
jgi:transposase-like protein